jgi:hypothetical protein
MMDPYTGGPKKYGFYRSVSESTILHTALLTNRTASNQGTCLQDQKNNPHDKNNHSMFAHQYHVLEISNRNTRKVNIPLNTKNS